ncbi:hypothetical protein HO133_003664 [Letharia lupina]|uniref:Uncharacterized protein n=1 Tax=Letharia lupina TaxID=560253 RepID=A0A8H6CAE7_9LECA|nr:uncharacterized protein HO133_003664 [Letharia lupina]KAF6219839.1 hypothetical protein HO133_003664 [Letharia lupina]
MSSFIFLLLWTVVQCLCAATAPSPSYTTFQDQSSPPSPTLNARNSPICVRVAQNPDWAGAIDAKHCADAIGRLWDRTLPQPNSSQMLHPARHGKSPKDQSTVSSMISFGKPRPSSNERDGV